MREVRNPFLGGYLRFRKIGMQEGAPPAKFLKCPFLKRHMRNRRNFAFKLIGDFCPHAAWCCFSANLSQEVFSNVCQEL